MEAALDYVPLGGERHRHGATVHSHPHRGPHAHPAQGHHHHHGHGHSHGLLDPSIKRSREGLKAVGLSLAVLGLTALAQVAIYLSTGSVALLADLIHNFGDAATAIPLGIAFLLRSESAERGAGLFVVAAIFVSACVAGVEAISRLIHPQTPTHLLALAAAGLIGFGGNWLAAIIHPRGQPARQPGPDRRRQPRPRRFLRQPRRGRQRNRRRARPADCRPADRTGDHRRHSQDHLELLAHRARQPHPLALAIHA